MQTPEIVPPSGSSSAIPDWRRGTSRRLVWVWVTSSYAVDVTIVALFAVVGTVPWHVPAAHAVASAVVSAMFYRLLHRAVDHAGADPYFTMRQVVAGTAVQLGGILLAPSLALVYLNVLFVVFAFGSLRLSRRHTVTACLAATAGIGLVLTAVWPRMVIPHARPIELALLVFSYGSTMARCAFVGLQGSRLREQLRHANDQLVSVSQRIERMARHDELTGLLNRRSIRALLEDHATLASRGLEDLAVAILDLDHFKSVNDRFGHAVGDQVLHTFGLIAAQTLRVTDHVGRYGGEEFLCLLTCSTVDEVQAAMERVRANVAAYDWGALAPGLTVTVSIGIAVFEPGHEVTELLREADDALYAAKHQGRDRVILAA